MPKLIKMYIRHTVIGFVIAAIFVALLIWLNVANLRHLVTHAEGGYLALVMLVIFNGIVFSGVQFGIAVMGMAEPENKGSGDGGTPLPVPDAIAVRADR